MADESRNSVEQQACAAKTASLTLGCAPTAFKNSALRSMSRALTAGTPTILAANRKDVVAAERLVAEGKLGEPLLARLQLNEKKLADMARGIRAVARQEDPVGRIEDAVELDRGFNLYRVTASIGVIGFIFESRPDAVPQIVSLAIKSGNAVLLKGGREATRTNRVLVKFLKAGLVTVKSFPSDAVQLLETRGQVHALLELDKHINLIIPRGSNEFVRFIQNNTRIPVLGHADGICAVYVDSSADLEMAVKICVDAKTQYPAVCNAMETMLVHEGIAHEFLPSVKERFDAAGVTMRGCPQTRGIVSGVPAARKADYTTEYLDLIVAVKVVSEVGAAIDHINTHGSGHTDAIVTKNRRTARRFLNGVDSACVLHNASTRFADGFRFGKGAEVGISTNRFHARGPVGLDGLVIYNYRATGSGQVVRDYVDGNRKRFTHKPLIRRGRWRDLK